jgi:hypothetical protein
MASCYMSRTVLPVQILMQSRPRGELARLKKKKKKKKSIIKGQIISSDPDSPWHKSKVGALKLQSPPSQKNKNKKKPVSYLFHPIRQPTKCASQCRQRPPPTPTARDKKHVLVGANRSCLVMLSPFPSTAGTEAESTAVAGGPYPSTTRHLPDRHAGLRGETRISRRTRGRSCGRLQRRRFLYFHTDRGLSVDWNIACVSVFGSLLFSQTWFSDTTSRISFPPPSPSSHFAATILFYLASFFWGGVCVRACAYVYICVCMCSLFPAH